MDTEKALSAELDLLPEHCHYQDAGCEMAKSCLACPLPQCIYDTPRGKQVLLKQKRNGEIARLFREEARNIRELAQLFAISTRTVQRVIQKHKDRHSEPATSSPIIGDCHDPPSLGLATTLYCHSEESASSGRRGNLRKQTVVSACRKP